MKCQSLFFGSLKQTSRGFWGMVILVLCKHSLRLNNPILSLPGFTFSLLHHLRALQLEIFWLCLNPEALYSMILETLFRLFEWLRQLSVKRLIKCQTTAARKCTRQPFRGLKNWGSVKQTDAADSQLSNQKRYTYTRRLNQVLKKLTEPVFQTTLWTWAMCLHPGPEITGGDGGSGPTKTLAVLYLWTILQYTKYNGVTHCHWRPPQKKENRESLQVSGETPEEEVWVSGAGWSLQCYWKDPVVWSCYPVFASTHQRLFLLDLQRKTPPAFGAKTSSRSWLYSLPFLKFAIIP